MTFRIRRVWLTMLVALVLALYFTWIQFNVGYVGIGVEKSDEQWVVTRLSDGSWAIQSGIRIGDSIKEINGLSPETNKMLMKYRSVPTAKEMVIERDGEFLRFDFTDLADQPFSFNQTLVPIGLFTLLYLFSVYIAYKKTDDRAAYLLILFFMAGAIGYLAAGANIRGDNLAAVIMKLCIIIIPVLFVHFLVLYFRPIGIRVLRNRVIVAFYLLVAFWILMEAVYEYGNPPYMDIYLSITFNGVLLLFAFGMTFAMALQARLYVRCRNTPHQSMLKFMLIGNVSAFAPFILLFIIPEILFGKSIVGAGIAASFFLFLPLTYMYLLASHKLLDINFIMSRLRYYCFIAALPSGFLVFVVGLVLRREPFHPVQWVQAFLVVYLGIVLFLYGKEVIDRRFRNKLIKGAHRFEESLESFSHRVAAVMKVNDLEKCLADEVFTMLPVRSVAFLERECMSGDIMMKWHQGPIPLQDVLPQIKSGIGRLGVGQYLKTVLGNCYVIGESRNVQHLMWISDKNNYTELNHDERVWLRTLITYAGFVYENLQLIEGLVHDLDSKSGEKAPPWVLRLLFRLSENERRRLASDLHDSALQDQLMWYRKLEALTNDNDSHPLEMRKELAAIQEGLLDVMHQIRETCNELRPPFLQEMGIVEALENLCSHTQLHANYAIEFDHRSFDLRLDGEYVLTIYRITQELLRNSMKHAKATKVELRLWMEDGTIRYRYRDNGIGMETDRLQSSFQHMGLSGIRERVRGLEGKTIFRSTLGEGFEISISLPLPEGESETMLGNEEGTA
ncbi:ATP-binding protein [Paenibacillus tarimensis]